MSLDFWLSPWTIGSTFAALTAFAIAGWWFAPAVAAFFINTKLGRRIAVIGGAVFAVWLAFVAVFAAGRRKERDALRDASGRKEQERDARDAELKTLPPDKLVERAKPWLRDKP